LNDLQNLWKNEQDENKKIAYQTLKESNIDISQIITKTIK
jgi:hypothetical protein